MANVFDEYDAAERLRKAEEPRGNSKNVFDQFDEITIGRSDPASSQSVKEEDPIRAEVRKEIEAARKQGISAPGLDRLAVQGATFNLADEALAGALTIPEMIKRGTWDPRVGYQYAKARQDLDVEEARKNAGWMGTAADIGGGVLTGSTLARGGLTLGRALTPRSSLADRTILNAADAIAMGTVAGLGEGNSLQERTQNAATGGAVGGGLGLVGTPAAAAVRTLASPVVSAIRARMNPGGFAESQLGRGVAESSRTAQQIADDVATAAREGQGMYTVADAMGNPGQRLASGVGRAPGQGRTDLVEFLEGRQADQSRRVAATLAEGFEAPITAQQARAHIREQRQLADEANYGAARQHTGFADVTPAIRIIDANLRPGSTGVLRNETGISDNFVESTLRRVRRMLTDDRSNLTGFDSVLMAKREIDHLIESGTPTIQRTLIPIKRAIDDELALKSWPYSFARNTHRGLKGASEAVDEGALAYQRGRTEDVIQRFNNLNPTSPQGQAMSEAAFRIGYADPAIAAAQAAPFGQNAARPFTSTAFRDESAAIAPQTSPLMNRRLGRENTMFETRRQATGGSQTADNLADAQRVDPSLLANIVAGNFGSALRQAIVSGQNALTGNTPAVRQELARLLLQRGNDPRVLASLRGAEDRIRRAFLASQLLGRGVMGGVATSSDQLGSNY